jgi:[acyl-carrier-protein] S-malonyltransferase
VLAGAAERLDDAEQACLAAGASRTVRLAVRTPSHTAQLEAASAAFADLLTPFGNGRLTFPVLSAIDGRPAHTRAEAGAALARQISTPLDWEACMQTLAEMQPDAVLEIGPCNALTRLLNEIAPDLPVRACEDFRSIDGIVGWVGGIH